MACRINETDLQRILGSSGVDLSLVVLNLAESIWWVHPDCRSGGYTPTLVQLQTARRHASITAEMLANLLGNPRLPCLKELGLFDICGVSASSLARLCAGSSSPLTIRAIYPHFRHRDCSAAIQQLMELEEEEMRVRVSEGSPKEVFSLSQYPQGKCCVL